MVKEGLPRAAMSADSSNSKTAGMGCRSQAGTSFRPASAERGCVERDHCGIVFIPSVCTHDAKQAI